MDDRAVSELVGYTIIFGMVVLISSSIVVIGTSTLADSRDRERVNNAEAAFEILAENIEEHATDRAVGRSTEIRVTDAALYFGAEEDFYVTVTPEGEEEQVYLMTGEPIVYESSHDSRVVYSNGAVFRETDRESRMIEEPSFRIDDEKVVLPHITISGTDRRLSISESRTVLVRTEQRTPRFYRDSAHDEYGIEITIVTEPARAAAWEGYLESHEVVECSIDGSAEEATVTCTITEDSLPDEFYIPETRLSGDFS